MEEYFHHTLVDEYYRCYDDVLLVNEHKMKLLFNRLYWFKNPEENTDDAIVIAAIENRIIDLLDYGIDIFSRQTCFYDVGLIKKHVTAGKLVEAFTAYQRFLDKEINTKVDHNITKKKVKEVVRAKGKRIIYYDDGSCHSVEENNK